MLLYDYAITDFIFHCSVTPQRPRQKAAPPASSSFQLHALSRKSSSLETVNNNEITSRSTEFRLSDEQSVPGQCVVKEKQWTIDALAMVERDRLLLSCLQSCGVFLVHQSTTQADKDCTMSALLEKLAKLNQILVRLTSNFIDTYRHFEVMLIHFIIVNSFLYMRLYYSHQM